MNDLTIFENSNFGKLTVIEKDGEPWFIAKEICGILGLGNASQSVVKLRSSEKGIILKDTAGGKQQTIIINETGLYLLIMRSRKSEAIEFQRWIANDILPQIRKTGSYSSAPQTYIESLKALVIAEEAKEKLQIELKEAQPAIEFKKTVTASDNSMRIGDYAKMLSKQNGIKIGPNKLFKFLRHQGFLMAGRDPLERNKPYQSAILAHLFEYKLESIDEMVFGVPYITGFGQFELNDLIVEHFCQ